MALVALVAALVDVSTFPGELAKAALLIEFILTFISVAVGCIYFLTPAALAVFHTVLEIAYIVAAVLPLVLAEAVWLSELVLARVNVTISENVCALAVLETVAPFSLISVSIFPFVDTISVSFGRSPLTDIRITKNTFPDTLALL